MGTEAPRRSWLALALRIGLTGAVFALIFTRIEVDALAESVRRIPPLAALGAAAVYVVAIGTGVWRWRVLLAAYGARPIPSWAYVSRWYLISTFYNLLPGGVGGDVLRGIATRDLFDGGSRTRAVGVVFVERVLGLGGLLIISGVATLTSPQFDRKVLIAIALGLAGVCVGVASVAFAPTLSRWLPARLSSIALALPRLERPSSFVLALLISLLSHLTVSVSGYLLIHALTGRVSLLQSFVVFPLGALASVFPLTIAGAGTRDATIVFLLAQIGVERSDALVTSLFILMCQLVMSALGGALQGRRPLLATATSPES